MKTDTFRRATFKGDSQVVFDYMLATAIRTITFGQRGCPSAHAVTAIMSNRSSRSLSFLFRHKSGEWSGSINGQSQRPSQETVPRGVKPDSIGCYNHRCYVGIDSELWFRLTPTGFAVAVETLRRPTRPRGTHSSGEGKRKRLSQDGRTVCKPGARAPVGGLL